MRLQKIWKNQNEVLIDGVSRRSLDTRENRECED